MFPNDYQIIKDYLPTGGLQSSRWEDFKPRWHNDMFLYIVIDLKSLGIYPRLRWNPSTKFAPRLGRGVGGVVLLSRW